MPSLWNHNGPWLASSKTGDKFTNRIPSKIEVSTVNTTWLIYTEHKISKTQENKITSTLSDKSQDHKANMAICLFLWFLVLCFEWTKHVLFCCLWTVLRCFWLTWDPWRMQFHTLLILSGGLEKNCALKTLWLEPWQPRQIQLECHPKKKHIIFLVSAAAPPSEKEVEQMILPCQPTPLAMTLVNQSPILPPVQTILIIKPWTSSHAFVTSFSLKMSFFLAAAGKRRHIW